MNSISMSSNKVTRWLVMFLYGCAALQFIRYYNKSTRFYLSLPSYLSGHERLPFQERILPIFFIKAITYVLHLPSVAHHLPHSDTALTANAEAVYLINLVAFFVAALYTQKLYNAASVHHGLRLLVFPVFLFSAIWTYSLHNEANFSYPYDLPSLAFFTAGLYFIYCRRFLALTLILLIGTLNRETTFFLIGLYLLDAASVKGVSASAPLLARFSLRLVSWWRVALLSFLWAAVKLTLAHHYAGNDSSENYIRILENLGRLKLRLLPALLNICGYLIPVVLLFRRELRPTRIANYLLILPLWFGVMFYTGVIIETRIYGELCSFAAVAIVLIIEHHLTERHHSLRLRHDSETHLVA